MAITIAIANEKGGVGKTTTTVSLGGCYARLGRRTLLIDMDPQASLTRGLLGSLETDQLELERTVAVVFQASFFEPSRLIQPTAFANLSLVPGSRALKAMNRLEPSEYGERQFALRELVNEVGGQFEVILTDNPPNLEFCSWASLTAADYVITPLQAEDYGAQGIRFVNEAVATIRASTNPRLMLLGYLRSLFQKRAAVHLAYSEALAVSFPGLLFDNYIPYATQYREAIIQRTPINFYKPKVEAAKAIERIVAEIDQRINRLGDGGSIDERRVA